ncbi:uncharacterized protein C8Q71DRAFT_851621 [Rhodofomes roseus]|uniref:F-box domain-containing protein n=1 Tax=Rhodofomes roseus TaxID=34475 RepID=A0ABQ8JZK0_9APHY|nr:uncharacterized protein C8Q71DRAFT_851621 [Rhodofomes roseus]KAH9829696.1 hypothetical protein C8Q71DRAFT_851621 [Rhodofomes roseus]
MLQVQAMSKKQISGIAAGTTRLRQRVSVNDLPPDILLLIFRELLLTVRDPAFHGRFLVGWNDKNLEPWPPYDSSMSPLPFPESIASVCRHWRGVMSIMSLFWTRLVIWVGNDPTSLSTIRDYLTWSRDSLLDIYVLCRLDAATNNLVMQAVMETLAPHMKRWRLLRMKVLRASSLPRPRIEIVGRADRLIDLEMQAVVDDSEASVTGASPVSAEFSTPVLERLRMGNVHFHESYVKLILQYRMPPKLSHLTILDYGLRHTNFPLVDLLECITECKGMLRVKLANLRLDCSYSGPPLVRRGIVWCAFADFVDMRGDEIAEYNRLLSYPYVHMTSYTRCSMEVPSLLGNSYYIKATEIASAKTLLTFLAAQRGPIPCSKVLMVNCDGLRHEVLRVMGFATNDNWVSPCLKSLAIVGCKQFSSMDLRYLLEARRSVHEATGFPEAIEPGYVVGSIEYLNVEDCCELASEDREWFDAHVSSVRWDDWSGGYGNSPAM